MDDQNETIAKPARIPLEEADLPTLKAFAELSLGLEVKPQTNSNGLRAKIKQVMPDCKDVPALAAAPEPIVPQRAAPQGEIIPDVEGEDPIARPAAVSLPPSTALSHASRDPKVKLKIHKTSDPSRAKEVFVGVNGDVTQIKRGEEVVVPYRVYVALNNAIEKVAIDTDEINPITQMPFKAWEDVPSYPFSVIEMPSAAEIADWEARTGSGFQKARG